MAGQLPVVVALGSVDPALVTGVLDGHCRFVPDPGDADLGLAAGAIARADARVDQALLDKAPALRVVARTGVGVDLVDVAAATARGIAVVITPGAGAGAVAEGALSRRATAATFTAAARGVLDVLAGREPQAVANPGWRTHRHPERITHDQLR